MNLNLNINSVYQMCDSSARFRVLETDLDNDKVTIVPMDRSLARPQIHDLSRMRDKIAARSLIQVMLPSEATPEMLLMQHRREYRDRIMAIIEPLVKHGVTAMLREGFWAQIVAAAKKAGISNNSVYKALTRYFQAGCNPNAIVPRWHKCGRRHCGYGAAKKDYQPTSQPGAYALSAIDIHNIKAGAEKFYVGSNTWAKSYDETLKKYYCTGIDMIDGREVRRTLPAGQKPSFWQYFRIAQKHLGTIKKLKGKLGQREYELTSRGKPGSQAASALLPGLVAEIDWTFTDTVVVRRNNRLSIGRLVVYGIVDRASGIVLSIYVTLSTGKWEEAAKAILICAEDKVDLCAQHGIKITPEQWPVQHLFDTLVSDKGEIDSWKATPIGTGLGAKLIHTPAKRPDTKGTIEAFMKAVNFHLWRKWPGKTTGLRQRCVDNPNVTAIYDFDEVNTILHGFVVFWNQRIRRRQPMTKGMLADKVLPVSTHIWKWADESGCLRSANLLDTRQQLLPWKTASVTEYGFELKGLRYIIPSVDPGTPGGIDSNEWLAKARRERWKVNLAIDPATVDHVWIRHAPRGKSPVMIKCPLAPGQDAFAGFSWEEYRLACAEKKLGIKEYMEGPGLDTDRQFGAIVDSVTAGSREKTGAARVGMSKTAQINGVAQNRQDEIAERSGNKAPPPVPKQEPLFKSFLDEDVWGPETNI